jgi:Zn-dependent protease
MAFVFSIWEVLDMIAMAVIVGIIFMDFLKRFRQTNIEEYYTASRGKVFWNDFKFAVIATVPAILLHELGHKFVAMAFGLTAVFKAAYLWLGIGLVLKFTGFVFFVPAYVSISGPATTPPHVFSIVAFAGPGVNLVLWLLALVALKRNWFPKYRNIIYLTKWINLLLFVFNMLPLPGFDGLKVYQGLYHAFF